MKKIFAGIVFLLALAFVFESASAQVALLPYKIPIYNGVGGVSQIDTGSSYQTFKPNGPLGPQWVTSGRTVVQTVDTLTTGQTLIGSLLQFNAADTQTYYRFRGVIFDSSTSAPGVKLGFAGPSGATIRVVFDGQDSSATLDRKSVVTALATASAAFQTQATSTGAITFEGIVKIGSTAGNFILQFLKNTSGTAAILAKSYIVWEKVY